MKQNQHYEATVSSLRNQNYDSDTYAREGLHNAQTQLDMYKTQLENAYTQITVLQEENDSILVRNAELTDTVTNLNAMVKTNEQHQLKLEASERKVKDLEAEVIGFGEWKKLEDVFQVRLAKVSDLERECERLTRDNKNLAETIGNKLLLEEQVHDLKSRLEMQTRKAAQHIDLVTQLQAAEQENKTWKKMTMEFCPSNSLVTPQALRAHINNMQKEHLVLADSSCTAKVQKSATEEQLQELRTENEFNVQKIATLTTTLRNYKGALHRLQKRLALIARERDCFKNLLENYEKDLTISAHAADTHGDNELKTRLDVLEKSLAGYKDICNTLEKELIESRSLTDVINGDVQPTSEYIEHLRQQMDNLRKDNERLQRRKDELEELADQDKMKQAYGIGTTEKELKVGQMKRIFQR